MQENPIPPVKWTGLWLHTLVTYAAVAFSIGMGCACLWQGYQINQLQRTLSRNQYLIAQMIVKYGEIEKVDAQINWKKATLESLKMTLREMGE